MEIKVSIDESKLLKMVMDGCTEKEMATDLRVQLKQRVRERLELQLSRITKEEVNKVLKSGVIADILRTDLRERVIKQLKTDLDDMDFCELIADAIADNIKVKASVNIK